MVTDSSAGAPFDLRETTVSEMRDAIRSGDTTARALVEGYRERVERYDGELGAVVALNDRAVDRADDLDRQFAESGFVGPLHGVPVVVKDNVDTSGVPTTGGSTVFEGSTPPDDAFVVERLRDAGAVILAKANLHELARSGTTASTLGGQTRNPYALDRTPGGSSGGSAAAVAANLGAVSLGTDTMNSIRSPASACNCVGLRPTLGLVSRDGIMPIALSQDTAGPITRTVADAAAVLDAISGYDPADRVTARCDRRRPPSYTDHVGSGSLECARLGVLRSVFDGDSASEAVHAVTTAAIADLEAAGATTIPVDEEFDVDRLVDRLGVQRWEMRTQFDDYLDERGPAVPVSSLEAFVATGEYHPSIEDKLLSACEVSSPMRHEEYLRRLRRRERLRRRLHVVFADADLDALVFPHQSRLVAEIGERQRGRNGFLAAGTGFPSIAVPAGFSSGGVPVGVEFLGRPFDEPTLLGIADAYERATRHRRPPDRYDSADG
jgi:Asp-tRNA(Asn)/Glu-tRNA(Gln) amidotransferase A subunit family amidase